MESNPSVLIIDDDPSIRASLEAYLEDRSFRVRTADNGKTGLSLIQEDAPDVVLLDLSMPRASGFDVLSAEGKAHPAWKCWAGDPSGHGKTTGSITLSLRILDCGVTSCNLKSEVP